MFLSFTSFVCKKKKTLSFVLVLNMVDMIIDLFSTTSIDGDVYIEKENAKSCLDRIANIVLEKAITKVIDFSSLSKDRVLKLLRREVEKNLFFNSDDIVILFRLLDEKKQKEFAERIDIDTSCKYEEWFNLCIEALIFLKREKVHLFKEIIIESFVERLFVKVYRTIRVFFNKYLIDYSKLLFRLICSFSYHRFLDEEDSNNNSVIRICY